ncbi:VWA domain-containing protein [Bacteroides sp. 224]|uniref:vWA domain-containing protein n=1 Tax=Bacteroides sp. 224 TaxID=2302936 RepID=UPI0013D81ECE|nr:VWA domain-containing protein [Bacteroides sp. 224]NDV64786.1 VWA domain-containing protein [Bacteroides sp. 224]
MKHFILLTVISMTLIFSTMACNVKAKNHSDAITIQTEKTDEEFSKEAKIQLAILLDTSSSMDGLINQAKARLWNIVNTLTTLKYKGKTPEIEIALYEYGNSGIPQSKNFIRQVTPLTSDLDLISEKLFALTTNGGSEYCGAVISEAVQSLEWGRREADMKLIYIAGNEPFTQGPVNYKKAVAKALDNEVYVNTILCGDWGDKAWQDAAVIGKGKYFTIDHNAAVRHYDTPYDDQISECNKQLNATYVGYGHVGTAKKQSQAVQDENAMQVSSSNYAERAVSKTKKAYNNSSWDLVDKVKEDKEVINKLQQTDLPKELQGKSKEEIVAFVAEKDKQRKAIQEEISALAIKRQAYIDEQMKKDADNKGDDLGEAINLSVCELAVKKGYVAENNK